MKTEINGKALIAIAMLSTGIVLADYVSIANVKDSGGINVTGGVTETELNSAIDELNTTIKALQTRVITLEESQSKIVKLWNGSSTKGSIISLSEDVNEYDVITVIGSTKHATSNQEHFFSSTYTTEDLLVGGRFEVQYTVESSHVLSVWFDYNSGLSLTTSGTPAGAWVDAGIKSVYGIKY